jgi:L-gulonate 5-dehydrogenase
MRVAKLVELNKIEVVDLPVPEIENDTDVQVQVKAVGVCGTDLHMFREHRADVQLPRIMGHELSGLVTKVGAGVTRVKVGDRVVLDPVFACGTCPTCKKGYPNVCSSVRCYGVQMDGGYADYIVVGQEHLYPFDPSISYEEAALAEPFSIASNILDRVQLTDKDNVLLIGSGTIGLSIVQVAKSFGARILVSDVADDKLAIATSMGADAVVNSKTVSLDEAAESFAPGGFDVVIDAVGITPLFQQSINYAAPRARIACIGFDARPAEIPPVVVTKKELTIVGSRMNCYRFPIVMQWLNDGKIQADKMISRKYSIDDIQKAFEETLANSATSVKTLIVFE